MSNFNYNELAKIADFASVKLSDHLISDSECDNDEHDEALVLDELQSVIRKLDAFSASIKQRA